MAQFSVGANRPELKQELTALFGSRTRDAWCAVLDGSDACWAPMLRPDEATRHPHLQARSAYLEREGALQAAPAPRFSVTPSPEIGSPPQPGADTDVVLRGPLCCRACR